MAADAHMHMHVLRNARRFCGQPALPPALQVATAWRRKRLPVIFWNSLFIDLIPWFKLQMHAPYGRLYRRLAARQKIRAKKCAHRCPFEKNACAHFFSQTPMNAIAHHTDIDSPPLANLLALSKLLKQLPCQTDFFHASQMHVIGD
jgi:hypothetical protein